MVPGALLAFKLVNMQRGVVKVEERLRILAIPVLGVSNGVAVVTRGRPSWRWHAVVGLGPAVSVAVNV